MIQTKSALPFGVVTLVLVGVTWAYSWWYQDACQTLEERLGKGYFLRWAAPELLLITAQKESIVVESQSKTQACELMLETLNQRSSQQ